MSIWDMVSQYKGKYSAASDAFNTQYLLQQQKNLERRAATTKSQQTEERFGYNLKLQEARIIGQGQLQTQKFGYDVLLQQDDNRAKLEQAYIKRGLTPPTDKEREDYIRKNMNDVLSQLGEKTGGAATPRILDAMAGGMKVGEAIEETMFAANDSTRLYNKSIGTTGRDYKSNSPLVRAFPVYNLAREEGFDEVESAKKAVQSVLGKITYRDEEYVDLVTLLESIRSTQMGKDVGIDSSSLAGEDTNRVNANINRAEEERKTALANISASIGDSFEGKVLTAQDEENFLNPYDI